MKPPSKLTARLALALPACSPTVSSSPPPRVTEFPPALQASALAELNAPPPKPALTQMLDAMAADRAHNRSLLAP